MPKIRISPIAVILSFLIVYSMPPHMLASYISAVVLHELGHICAALVLRSPIESITISPLGINIRRALTRTSHFHDILIYGAGPLISLITGIFGHLLGLSLFSVISFSLLLINMLPIKVLDGGKILYSLLCICLPERADSISKVLSGVLLLVLWLISVYLLIITSELSLFILCFYLFFAIFV